MKKPVHLRAGQKNSGIASYESLLDLFTLLSFILIVASYLFVSQSRQANNISAVVTTGSSKALVDVPATLRKDVALLRFSRTNGENWLTLVEGTSRAPKYFSLTTNNVDANITLLARRLAHISTVELAIPAARSQQDPALIVYAQQGLTEKGITNLWLVYY